MFIFLIFITVTILWFYSGITNDSNPSTHKTTVNIPPFEYIDSKPVFNSSEERIYYQLLNPICENQLDTTTPNIKELIFTDENNNIDFTDRKSLKDFCKPYIYTQIFLQLGSSQKGNCSSDSKRRGKDCLWYHMCVWPPEMDQFISNAICNGMVWEMELMFLSQRILKKSPKGIVFDVGANIGQYLLQAAALEHTVFAFEPIPEHVEMMKRSAILNGFQNRIHIFQNGIADYSSTVYINVHKNNKGGSTIDKLNSNDDETQSDSRFESRISIDLITLNDMLPIVNEKYPKVPVVFMKADIEGYEPRMFRGGYKFFAQKQIPLILLEILGKSFNRTMCDLRKYMLTFGQLGYDIYSTTGHYYREKDIIKMLNEEWDTPEKLRPLTLDLILEHNTTITNAFYSWR